MADPTIKSAINAYNTALKAQQTMRAGGEAEDSGASGGTGGSGFADMLGSAIDRSIDNQYKSEKVSLDAVAKKASPVDLVTAVSQAELTLQTVVGVRDRMIAAYQDIMKMPI